MSNSWTGYPRDRGSRRKTIAANRRGISALLALLVVAVSPLFHPAHAGDQLIIAKSGTAGIYEQVETALRETLETLCSKTTGCSLPAIRTLEFEDLEKWDPGGESPVLIVTLGTQAARHLAEKGPPAPLLFTLVPRGSMSEVPTRNLRNGHSVIYLDQPPERQLRLSQQMSPAPRRIGVLAGDSNRPILDELHAGADRAGLSLVIEPVSDAKEIGSKLNRLLERSDALMALPDASIYNRQSIFNILLSSYHRQVPVIGFSAAYVKAGALLGVYASPADVGRHIAETVHGFLSNGQKALPEPAYARYFRVVVNPRVARSLNIEIPDTLEMEQRLREAGP